MGYMTKTTKACKYNFVAYFDQKIPYFTFNFTLLWFIISDVLTDFCVINSPTHGMIYTNHLINKEYVTDAYNSNFFI
jgi:hypothetical protein